MYSAMPFLVYERLIRTVISDPIGRLFVYCVERFAWKIIASSQHILPYEERY
jgi:hypothetical protein